jgi:hypothetical protein
VLQGRLAALDRSVSAQALSSGFLTYNPQHAVPTLIPNDDHSPSAPPIPQDFACYTQPPPVYTHITCSKICFHLGAPLTFVFACTGTCLIELALRENLGLW